MEICLFVESSVGGKKKEEKSFFRFVMKRCDESQIFFCFNLLMTDNPIGSGALALQRVDKTVDWVEETRF